MCAHRDAVNKLHGTPEAVELHALVNMHHTVGGRRSAPHAVLQEAADACQDDLEHGEAAAQTLFGQQVSLTGNGNLLVKRNIPILYNPVAHFVPSYRQSGVKLTCGVPNLSIRGTRWRGAYFASSLFILTSRRSPSV